MLFDELGAGTDPNEGASLAIAILEDIISIGARAAATTHYSELKAYSMTAQKMENASVEFDAVSLKPTYKLNVGVPGMSNALAISERLGLDSRLVNRARELLKAERVRFENVLLKAEEHRWETQRSWKMRWLKNRRRRLRELRPNSLERIWKGKIWYSAKSQEEARRLIEEADKKAAQYIEELKALKENASDEALIKNADKAQGFKVQYGGKDFNAPQSGRRNKKGADSRRRNSICAFYRSKRYSAGAA